MKTEIINLTDVKTLVDTFYARIGEDALLGPIFNAVIQDQWPAHLTKMYSFWQSLLLGENTYSGRPFVHHIDLPIEALHFERWLALFDQTVDALFIGEKAVEAKKRAANIAQMFQHKLANMRSSAQTSLLDKL